MSGIVGIVNLNGAPPCQRLLRRMTGYLAFRGPDAQEIWANGAAGFGHAMLRTTEESAGERQPFSFDGNVRIIADARIDGRQDLVRKLKAGGCDASPSAPDVELILRAYQAWGEDCVEHLLGDFAFAIWDERRRHLFCARDHFGVKPFFYAQAGDYLIFSNTLNCLRLHPAVSDELNDLAIADFLLFGNNQDVATTAFAGVRRLPPAHCLRWSDGSLRLRRYWTLPADVELQYRRARDYIDEFQSLLGAAVEDRLRTAHIGVAMSGGLDSTIVAATARKLLAERFSTFDLRAYCIVYDHLIPDQERRYAGLVAEALGIPIDFLAADDYQPYEDRDQPALRCPEPVNNPMLTRQVEFSRRMAANCRVALTGWDGDTVLGELLKPHFSTLIKERRFGGLAREVWRYVRWKGAPPPVGVRTWLRQWRRNSPSQQPAMPRWLNRDLAARLKLAERWEAINRTPAATHPIRPRLYGILNSPLWSQLFEDHDAGVISRPLEFRHPLADLRLIAFLLTVPPSPWLVSKELLRASARGILPEAVRRRPKSPLAGDPLTNLFRNGPPAWVEEFIPTPMLASYVERAAIPPISAEKDVMTLWTNLRPLSLDHWLRYSITSNRHFELEDHNVSQSQSQREYEPIG